MTRWTMLADLERCVGCQTCTAACRHANATSPAVQWRKVLDVEAGSFPHVNRTFVPVGCQHCADPPCMHVCPSTATRQRPDGIVTIDYDLCIGCAYCDVACPYQARFIVHEPHFAYGPAMQNEAARFDDRRMGVAQKCTFCSDRIDYGLDNGLTPGRDPRATPACVNACIADALVFGDIEDPASNVSQLLREQAHFRMHAEVGTEPSFYYLYGKANNADDAPRPAAATALPASLQAPAAKIRTRGVEPWRQQHWNWKAAANFLCGGAGAGLFAFVALAGLGGAPVLAGGLTALAVVAVGLFLLLFKIGQPFRFSYVLRQPQRSWMSREAWVAGAFFPVALLAVLFENGVALILAALLGFAFMVCQAMMFYASKGIPAWRQQTLVPLLVATGFAEGSGLFLLVAAFVPGLQLFALPVAAALVMLVTARYLAWRFYVGELEREGAPTQTHAVFRAFAPWFLIGGLAVPLWLVAPGFILPLLTPFLFALAGSTALIAGWAFKLILVTRAGFNQGFALTHTPVRGVGVAGPAVKPGWSVH